MPRTRTIELELQSETRQLPGYGRLLVSARMPTLTLMHHPKLRRIGERAFLPVLQTVHGQVEVSRLGPEFAQPSARVSLPLATHFLSRRPVSLVARPSGAVAVDASMAGEGVVRIDGVPLKGVTEIDPEHMELGVVLELGTQIVLLLHLSEILEEPAATPRFGLIGESDAMRDVREAIVRAARQNGPVLIRGETGTGKELVASAVHQASARREQPYVAVNMAAVPPTLAASELFGHAKGAFSGAVQASNGMFGRAHNGTLFMDEIGDTPLDVQAALLRVMETGEVQQVGADKVKQVDVRIIAATDADLEAAIQAGRFRAPLRYRLANLEIQLPPLRERKDDIGRLLLHFLGTELTALGRADELDDQTPEETSWVPAALAARLARYPWPGNVRQLRNVARWLATLDHKARPVDVADPALGTLLVGEVLTREQLSRPVDATTGTAPRPRDATAPQLPAAVPPHSGRSGPSGSTSGLPQPPVQPAQPAQSEGRATGERRKSALALMSPEELERLMEQHEFKLGEVADVLGVSRPALNDMIDAHPRLKRAQNLTLEEIVAARAQCGDIDGMWRFLRVSEKSLKLRMSALGLLS